MPAINLMKSIQIEAKVLKLHLKVRDEFSADLFDQHGALIHCQEDGYVPGFMPGEHFGDYVILHIDMDTGQIVNWKAPTPKQIESWIGQNT